MRNRVQGSGPDRRMAVATPLLLIAAAVATLLERRETRQSLVPVSGPERSVEQTTMRTHQSGHDGPNRVTCPQQDG